MENKFTITDPEKKLFISIQYQNDVLPEHKEKLLKMMYMALELWDASDKMVTEIDKALQKIEDTTP